MAFQPTSPPQVGTGKEKRVGDLSGDTAAIPTSTAQSPVNRYMFRFFVFQGQALVCINWLSCAEAKTWRFSQHLQIQLKLAKPAKRVTGLGPKKKFPKRIKRPTHASILKTGG